MTPTQFLFGKKQESTKRCLVAGGGSDGSDVPGHRIDLLGRLLLLPHTGFGNKLFIIIHYSSLSHRGGNSSTTGDTEQFSLDSFTRKKAEINKSALILKDYPHSTINLRKVRRPLALSRLTKT